MDDETEYAEVDDTQDEWEYDEPHTFPSRAQKALMLIGGMALSIAAGYMFGWAIGAALDRFLGE